jgi:PhnB protein
MQINSYLSFEGRCDEAIAFYQRALGAEVQMLMRFKDHPEPKPPQMLPEMNDKVMHASLRIGDTVIMASDGGCRDGGAFHGISLALSVADLPEAEHRFNALADGGQVQMPLAKTFFSPGFGMVADRFGVSWLVMVQA